MFMYLSTLLGFIRQGGYHGGGAASAAGSSSSSMLIGTPSTVTPLPSPSAFTSMGTEVLTPCSRRLSTRITCASL